MFCLFLTESVLRQSFAQSSDENCEWHVAYLIECVAAIFGLIVGSNFEISSCLSVLAGISSPFSHYLDSPNVRRLNWLNEKVRTHTIFPNAHYFQQKKTQFLMQVFFPSLEFH